MNAKPKQALSAILAGLNLIGVSPSCRIFPRVVVLQHFHLCLLHNNAAHSVCSPPSRGEGLAVGVGVAGPSRVHQPRPPPRRFAPTLPTRGRVKTEFAARAAYTHRNAIYASSTYLANGGRSQQIRACGR